MEMVARANQLNRIAVRTDRDKREAEAAILLACLSVLRRAKTHAVAAYRLGHDPGDAVHDTLAGNGYMSGLAPSLVDGMLSAHQLGRRRAVLNARDRSDVPWSTLAGLLLLDDAEHDRLVAEYERAVQPAIDQLSKRVATAVRQAAVGASIADLKEPRVELIELTPEQAIRDALNRAGVAAPVEGEPTRAYAVERLIETQVVQTYEAGRGAVLDNPAVSAQVIGFTYRTMRDDRVRPTHRAMEGVSRPVDDPLWDVWRPPCGFNCRCVLLEIFEGEPFKPTESLPGVQPDHGWRGGEYFGESEGRSLYERF
jgi:SPP1 gp7 family putative phage head morphogenesis protein